MSKSLQLFLLSSKDMVSEWKQGLLSIPQINRLRNQYSNAPLSKLISLKSVWRKKKDIKENCQEENMGQLDIEKGLGSETRSPIGKNKFSFFWFGNQGTKIRMLFLFLKNCMARNEAPS